MRNIPNKCMFCLFILGVLIAFNNLSVIPQMSPARDFQQFEILTSVDSDEPLQLPRERSGSVVECLTRDQRAAGSSLTGVTALWSLSKTHLS